MNKKTLKVGIVRFPGSNCDFDALHFFQKYDHDGGFIWYKEARFKKYDLIVIPGGFAFGDRVYKNATGTFLIDPGEQAVTSPVMKLIERAARRKTPILGICNGFQILVKAGLLPGKLVQNKSKQFYCDWTECKVGGPSFFGDNSLLEKVFKIPVAHGYGRYEISDKIYENLKNKNQIFLKYQGKNPNGSYKNIAGVTNSDRTIFGMMPHPERSPDGVYFIKAIENYVNK